MQSRTSISQIDTLVQKLKREKGYENSLDLARSILSLLDIQTAPRESFLQDQKVIQYEGWFQKHPILTSQRACVNLGVAADSNIQAKLYWLGKDSKKSTRQRIMGAVHFTPNYEDAEFTRQQKLPIGIDFFLSPDGDALTIALSNRGAVRVLSLDGHLTHTAKTILSNWAEAAGISDQARLHGALWNSFQLQEVNKKFYKEIARYFTELTQHFVKNDIFDDFDAKQYANRLIGRLLFVWFLRKKGVVNEAEAYFAVSVDSDEYYAQRLKKLFFATLNTPMDERADQKTPYLNGGLFEESNLDKNDKLSFPTGYFANIYNFFDEYNFTTDESTPDFEQVAIDPEMLGRIFENLLAEQVDETKTNARKASGAFYTPREIVDYMCRESLRRYLYGQLEGKVIDHIVLVDKLIDTSEQEWTNDESNQTKHLFEKRPADRDEVRRALEQVKILDPACGSGAFPMGMMQLLVRVFQRVDRKLDEYEVKLGILQDSIYGVDINPMAADISRLRAWLSLVVDEVPEKLKNEPLPNLDFKFITANSLIPLAEGDALNLFDEQSLDSKLADIRDRYFRARTKASKQKLRVEYRQLTSQVGLSSSKRSKQLQTFDPFDSTKCAQFFDTDYMFGIESFDIVVGNPPYGVKLKTSEKELYKLTYKSAQSNKTVKGSTDTYSLFIDLGLFHSIKDNGVLSYIVPLAFTSSEGMSALHRMILSECEYIEVSSYSNRPKKIFDNADQRVSIVMAVKTGTPTRELMTTKVIKRYATREIRSIIDDLRFINSKGYEKPGRIAKISSEIERTILDKISQQSKLENYVTKDNDAAEAIYYRAAGGRYYNLIFNYPTMSAAEKKINVSNISRDAICAILSSNLYFWLYQTYSDNLNVKVPEIMMCHVPEMDESTVKKLELAYNKYVKDLELNSSLKKASYNNISEFREYRARLSKHLIDDIDRLLQEPFGFTDDETSFLINYDIEFRTDEA